MIPHNHLIHKFLNYCFCLHLKKKNHFFLTPPKFGRHTKVGNVSHRRRPLFDSLFLQPFFPLSYN